MAAASPNRCVRQLTGSRNCTPNRARPSPRLRPRRGGKIVWTLPAVYGIARPSHTANRFGRPAALPGAGGGPHREGAMRRLGVWGVAATLALGLAGARGAAADGDTPPGAGLTGGMFARSAAQGKKLGPDEEAARQAGPRASAREALRKRQEEHAGA